MLESGQELSARFILVRRLGAGGGAEVWLAQDREQGRCVAVKILAESLSSSEAAIAAFERECAQVQALKHPHILQVQSLHRSVRQMWIAMEYASGGDLTRLRGRSPTEILRATIPVAAALAYAHRAGVVHRDVKAANVLLMADGSPRLADFGMSLVAATAPASDAGRGSLYTMSPQQQDGEPANASDDVYGFAAMLYELLSGYPPFWPNANADRIRRERPAALPESTPAALARLVDRMLAKTPGERPEMQNVERELKAVLAQAPTPPHMKTEQTSMRIEPPALRPPTGQGEPLRGEWRRTSGSAANEAELRRQGFRRGLGAAVIALGVLGVLIVFFALPRWMGGEPAALPAPVATLEPEKPAPERQAEVDFAELARAKQKAEEIRAAVDERLQKLTSRAAAQWGGADFQSAVRELAGGDAAYEKREYIQAAGHFEKIPPRLNALEQRAGAALKEQLQAGARALEQGRAEDAQAAFALALRIDPDNANAAAGGKRAATLDEVLNLVAAAERMEQQGEVNAALENFRKALALDPQMTRASEGASRIQVRLAADAFASHMARGYGALADAEYASARNAFEAARKIRPGAPEIAQALGQIEQEQRTNVIAAKLDEARELEAQEQWAAALAEYRAVVELDPTIAAASQGIERTTPRSRLHEQLELYLTQPERLFSQPVRAAANETLARAQGIADPGPLLKKQIATLDEWVARADKPVQIALQSDNLTHVTIYRVGELGAFDQRSLELPPGAYTVVGTRPGYRDVRRQISVAPGAALEPVVIRCEDRI